MIRLLLLSGLACSWCCSILLLRFHIAGNQTFRFMVWNLFLAAIPLGISLIMPRVRSRWAAALILPVWLLFFPNAPYVLTDLIHLKLSPIVPSWLDLLMLLSFALVSLWMGFESLRLMHLWVARRSGVFAGWCFATATLFLTGFGVYLGRFLRWNSWDILTRPWYLIEDIGERFLFPLEHLRTWGFTLGFGGLLVLAYLLWTGSRVEDSPAFARK
jgi:uncharacterized membrane protein